MSLFLSENLRKRSRKIRPGAAIWVRAKRLANASLARIQFPSDARRDLLSVRSKPTGFQPVVLNSPFQIRPQHHQVMAINS